MNFIIRMYKMIDFIHQAEIVIKQYIFNIFFFHLKLVAN